MKKYILLVLYFTSVSVDARGCLYYYGECVEECPDGTYRYDTGCDYLVPEPTCNDPFPKIDFSSKICDFSACYCEPPTVRNEVSKKCVAIRDCQRKPVTPRVPVIPGTPVTPRIPVTPRTPVTPRIPVTPRLPATSTEPIIPCLPVPPKLELPKGTW